MVGNSNSGRRPRGVEERNIIGREFAKCVGLLVSIVHDPEAPIGERRQAAQYLIDQLIGYPSQSVDTHVPRHLTITGAQIAEIKRKVKETDG